jgi:hypothetical protein
LIYRAGASTLGTSADLEVTSLALTARLAVLTPRPLCLSKGHPTKYLYLKPLKKLSKKPDKSG